MGVRIATQQDIPALKEIILSGLSNDSVWLYCYPSAGRSEAASNHVETVLKRIIDDNSKNWHCYVVDAPKTHDPVSLAIIQSLHQNEDDGKGVTEQIQRVFGLSEDPSNGESKTAKRIAALQSGITQTQQTYLARYDQVMFLHAVITHPHHKRQGRESLDQGQGATGERRSSFLDMFSFGGPKTPSAVDDDTRRKSHA
ncbi:uncharacterized protein Y057_14391 [Fusarium fujikuroi]|nr:uncharacterized protein Y057_14391 [Fusarium fujikuroi]